MNGIQEVSGSIPLISTKNGQFQEKLPVFLFEKLWDFLRFFRRCVAVASQNMKSKMAWAAAHAIFFIASERVLMSWLM